MRINEIITEGLNYPIICVDVQPEYAYFNDTFTGTCERIVQFVNKQSGPVLMFVNAEETYLSGDSIDSIKQYWEEIMGGEFNDETENWEHPIDWNRFTIVDKGYGYLRSWHDQGIADREIIAAIRLMYQSKVQNSSQLFGGDDSPTYEEGMKKLLGSDYLIGMGDPILVEWTSVAQLKRFNGAYLVGGGRNECLWEIKVLMNAFNIRYKVVDSLVYG